MTVVGVVDSGPPPDALADAARFDAEGRLGPARPDRLGHGTAVARVIRRGGAATRLRHAQVFDDRPVASAARVAAALRWLCEVGEAEVVCLSLGLSADRPVLAEAAAAAAARGVLLVAAHPARGASPYPAAYPGVVAAMGDARCGWSEISRIGPRLFGAWCNSPERGGAGMAGASIATARLTGHVAALLAAGTRRDPETVVAALAARSAHRGRGRRAA